MKLKLQTFKTDRADGRFVESAAFIHEYAKQHKPLLAYDPKLKGKRFIDWQGKVRRKLKQLLVFPKPPKQPGPKKLWSQERDGYELQKWECYPEPGCTVPYLMLIPDGVTKKNPGPAVMCIPGSGSTKEILAGEHKATREEAKQVRFCQDNWMAWHLVRAGFVCVAVDHPMIGELWGEIRQNREAICKQLIWMGRSYEGMSTFQKYGILQWLKSQPIVDRNRVVTCGHSLGAKPALLLGVLDPKLKAVVWNDMVSNWREQQIAVNLSPLPAWHYIPDFVRWFDYCDLMASLAPRHFLITEGGRTPDINLIRKSYRNADAARHIGVHYLPGFETAAKRPYDRKELPEGINYTDYLKTFGNVDVSKHCFHPNHVVPWLKRVCELD